MFHFFKTKLTSTCSEIAIGTGFSMLFDAVIIAMTLHQTINTLRVQGTRKEEWALSRIFMNRSCLIGILVRQGELLPSIYFICRRLL
jgi:hypothetical protein